MDADVCGLKSSLLPTFRQPRGLQGFPEPETVELEWERRTSGKGRAGKSPGEGGGPPKAREQERGLEQPRFC